MNLAPVTQDGAGRLIAAYGMPGALSNWGFAAVHAMADRSFGSHVAVAADTLDELLAAMAAAPSGPVVITSQYPQAALAEFVHERADRIVVFVESTHDSVAHLEQASGATDLAIVRAVSASCACLASLPYRPAAVLIHRCDVGHLPVGELEHRLAEALRLVPAEPPGLALSEHGTMTLSRFLAAETHSRCDGLGADFAEEVLAPYDIAFLGETEAAFAWPQASFLVADQPGRLLQGPVDLTGPARCIVYGPYLHLPAGAWTACVRLGFDAHVYEQSFCLELHGAGLLARIRVNAPSRPGLFSTKFDFSVAEPHIPLEMRVLTEYGAIEGLIDRLDTSFVPAG